MDDIKSFVKNLQSEDTVNLHKELNSLKKELFNLRFQKAVGDLKNINKFKLARKNIARINTELSKRLKKIGE